MRSIPKFPYLLLLSFLFCGSLGLQAQNATIAAPTVSGAPVCSGSTFSITFEVSNGNKTDLYFTAETTYTAYIYRPINSGYEIVFSYSFSSTTAPENKKNKSIEITQNIPIPDNIPGRNDYSVGVYSSNPVPDQNGNIYLSANFEIRSQPIKPVTTGGLICIGSTATLSASGAVSGDLYRWYNASSGGTLLKTSANNTDNTYSTPTTTVLSTTTNYWVSIINSNGCESTRSIVTATFPKNSPDSQTTAGTNTWIGHVYDGTNFGVAFNENFTNYFGTYSEAENFDQNFGGDNTCFLINSSLGDRSILTETFSVRYRMNSTKKGLYVVDLGSDDGSRLTVDGTLLYNNWSAQGWSSRPQVLMNLTGTSQLIYDIYENGGGNRVNFNNLTQILQNNLTENIDQSLCSGSTAAAISGDTFGTLPAGISAAGYQWTYSTSPEGTRNTIAGATSASFTPDVNVAPFNNPGTYYVFRNASLSSSNNVSPNPYVATNESNPAALTVKAVLPGPIASNNGPVCVGSTLNLFASTVDGATYFWIGPNGFVSALQNPQVSTNAKTIMAGTYSVTVTVEGCTSIKASTNVIVTTNITWTGSIDTNWNNSANWSCNSLPNLETDVLIPGNLASNNYPEINAGINALAKNLNIEDGASILVNANWLRIAGDLINYGVLNTVTGSISFEGATAQTILNAAFQNIRIQNLRIDNTSGVTSEAIIELTGILTVDNGNFNAGNELLTLISDATQTALIDGSGNGQVVGTVKMQRYLDVAFGYKYFSSPFQNSVVGDFEPFMDLTNLSTGFPHSYRYNENRNITINETIEDATGWEVYTGALNIAEGYALNFGDTNNTVLVEISGEVNNGPIAAKTLLNNHREYTSGFHLVGNPYPSPIDWNASNGWTRDNLDNAIYFFTASDTSQYTGSYTSFVNDVSTEDGRSSNIIPSMQGFFIKVSTSVTEDLVTGTFGMDNSVRTNDFNQEFLKTPEQDPKQLLRFTAGFTGESNRDGMVIYFSPYSTTNFEKEFDAHKLMNSDPALPNFYNITTNKKELAINAIPFPASGNYNKIPLGIKAEKSGKMSIALSSMENLSSNFNIYLIDHSKNIGQNLSQKSEYTFDITEGTHNSRFELMFSEEKVTNPAIAFNEPFHVEVINNEVVVKLNLEDDQEGILQASTMIGQVLQIKKGRGQEHIVFNGITSDGIYIINLLLGEARYSKKVIIKK